MPSAPSRRLVLIVTLFCLLSLATTGLAGPRGTVIEDFEGGSVVLESYPDQDLEPNAWEITSDTVYEGNHALRIYGNSWKTQAIDPLAVADSTVWQVAVYVARLGEMQAFGLSDGTNELLYTMAGGQLPQEEKWWTVYQGAFPTDEWYAYLLPVGVDWFATYGYHPTITHLVYINDDDEGPTGETIYDAIVDVTEDLPIAPVADILYTIESSKRVAADFFEVTAQFHGLVYDPDSNVHTFAWDFGDSTTSDEQDPLHIFYVSASYRYTVGLVVRDDDNLAGNDTCQVQVNAGPGDLPLTVNFVGDIFTGRQYESPGGIIQTHGIEALYEPTIPIFGDAADVSVCNLECAYTERGDPHPTKSVVFRSHPDNIVGVQYAGIDLVDLANNHIVDYGEIGMLDTMELLDGLGIPYSGAGRNDYFARQPTFWTEKGVRLGFLGQCNRDGRKWNYQPFLDAGYNKPGFAFELPHNFERAIAATRDLADIVIIQFHSGDEYQTEPPPGDGLTPPPVEAAEISEGDPDFQFRVEPTLGERELRRLAADAGADIVINHHPHVLQGFEAYDGKLIAHSLGNFIFDLSYAETMPTLVLTLEIEKTGITGYSFVPAWIDDFIPQPVTGQLAREIMDRMADYSRPMEALVAVEPAAGMARVYLSRAAAESTLTTSELVAELVEEEGYWISPPLELAGAGNLSQVAAVTGGSATDYEICWGREILWHGGFEAEGATLWDDNTEDEWLDDTVSWRGQRSLALRRDDNDQGEVGTDLEKHLPCNPATRHTAAGHMKADNAAEARIMARFYNSRYASDPLSSTDLVSRFTGTADWTRQWRNLETPPNGDYFELRCSNEPPANGTGHAWFDELKLIEWESWVPANAALDVPSPNNHRFLQVRSASAGNVLVSVTYDETAYYGATTSVAAMSTAPTHARLRNFPNPFNPRTTIELTLPGSGMQRVSVAIYDVTGRMVDTLFEGELPGGTRSGLSWDGTDARGRTLPSGVYFSRVEIGDRTLTHKLVLLR